MDAATQLLTALAGRHVADVVRREFDWVFAFGNGVALVVYGHWRILNESGIAITNADDGQKFGHPEPVNGQQVARQKLGQAVIAGVAIRPETGDISITFSTGRFWKR